MVVRWDAQFRCVRRIRQRGVWVVDDVGNFNVITRPHRQTKNLLARS